MVTSPTLQLKQYYGCNGRRFGDRQGCGSDAPQSPPRASVSQLELCFSWDFEETSQFYRAGRLVPEFASFLLYQSPTCRRNMR